MKNHCFHTLEVYLVEAFPVLSGNCICTKMLFYTLDVLKNRGNVCRFDVDFCLIQCHMHMFMSSVVCPEQMLFIEFIA